MPSFPGLKLAFGPNYLGIITVRPSELQAPTATKVLVSRDIFRTLDFYVDFLDQGSDKWGRSTSGTQIQLPCGYPSSKSPTLQ